MCFSWRSHPSVISSVPVRNRVRDTGGVVSVNASVSSERDRCDPLVPTSGLGSVSTAIVETPTAFCGSRSELVGRYLTEVIVCDIVCDATGRLNIGCTDRLFVHRIRYLVQHSLHVINASQARCIPFLLGESGRTTVSNGSLDCAVFARYPVPLSEQLSDLGYFSVVNTRLSANSCLRRERG